MNVHDMREKELSREEKSQGPRYEVRRNYPEKKKVKERDR
jgi:hypothetical protein